MHIAESKKRQRDACHTQSIRSPRVSTRPSTKPITVPGDLALPPRDEALRLFTGATSEERAVLLSGLLQSLWDAEKNGDLRPVRDWIVAWYTDLRFEDQRDLSAVLARLNDETTTVYTQDELLRILDLASGE